MIQTIQGLNLESEISRVTGHAWKTVAKIIKRIKSGIDNPIKKPHPSR